MKKLFALLLVTCPFLGNAQKAEIGIVGGAIPFTQFKAIDQPANTWGLKKESELGYLGGIRISLNLRGETEFGAACEYNNISQKSTAEGTLGMKSFSFKGLENDIAAGFVTPYIYFNTGVPLRSGRIYFGVSGGYGFGTMTNYNVLAEPVTGTPFLKKEDARIRGFVFGGQVGYEHYFSRSFAMNIEVAGRYAALRSDFEKEGVGYSNYEFKNGLLYIPTVIGFKLLIGERN